MNNEENKKEQQLQDDKPKLFMGDTDSTPFLIRSYWLNFLAHPNHTTITPSLILCSSYKRDTPPYAIVYFHYETDFTQKSAVDHYNSKIFYLHYHISMLEPIINLLKEGRLLYCFVKYQGEESWGEIRLGDDTIPVIPEVHP